jgi:4'-phosphopantetheinyl transferase
VEPWRAPAGELPWLPDAVHVWLAEMPDDYRPVPGRLSAAERERAGRFLFDRDRTLFIHHHAALRAILSGYTEVVPEKLPLAVEEKGKPVLEPPLNEWRFNLSHSGSAALVAVARGRQVGVDIERIRPRAAAGAIARRFFAAAECEALGALPEAAREAAFFSCWARKEAFIKGIGEGLSRGLGSFAVGVDPADPGPWRVEGWTVLALPAPPGYAGALAVEGDAPAVRLWRYRDPGVSA